MLSGHRRVRGRLLRAHSRGGRGKRNSHHLHDILLAGIWHHSTTNATKRPSVKDSRRRSRKTSGLLSLSSYRFLASKNAGKRTRQHLPFVKVPARTHAPSKRQKAFRTQGGFVACRHRVTTEVRRVPEQLPRYAGKEIEPGSRRQRAHTGHSLFACLC